MGRPTKRSQINKKISESMQENAKPLISKLKDAASRGERPVNQYRFAGVAEATYYRWMKENPQLKEELTRLLTDYRMAKIKEAALIGAPTAEQMYHANKMTEKEYEDLMTAHPNFFSDIQHTEKNALKLWSRKNIAESIQTKGNIADSWRYLEHMDKEMNKTRVEITDDEGDEADKALRQEYREKRHKNLLKKIDSLPDEE